MRFNTTLDTKPRAGTPEHARMLAEREARLLGWYVDASDNTQPVDEEPPVTLAPIIPLRPTPPAAVSEPEMRVAGPPITTWRDAPLCRCAPKLNGEAGGEYLLSVVYDCWVCMRCHPQPRHWVKGA